MEFVIVSIIIYVAIVYVAHKVVVKMYHYYLMKRKAKLEEKIQQEQREKYVMDCVNERMRRQRIRNEARCAIRSRENTPAREMAEQE
jgi:cell division protein FtsL